MVVGFLYYAKLSCGMKADLLERIESVSAEILVGTPPVDDMLLFLRQPEVNMQLRQLKNFEFEAAYDSVFAPHMMDAKIRSYVEFNAQYPYKLG